ncbi:MAG: DUF4256 domain-containing protein [Erysipelotrichaceae bacterium]|nr:DUF4256 domain-containing protein [Erysipelotrichaceae bacterium]
MIIDILKERFNKNKDRHPMLEWEQVENALLADPLKLAVLERMEESGGEPDTIGLDEKTGRILFCDCAKETPAGRRSLCYDREALMSRKKNPPLGDAVSQANEIGVRLLDETLYNRLQSTGEYDLKTSSWIDTPEEIRRLGGALFCERRYKRVFTFHNGADSYYSVRGWRGYLLV